MPKKLPKRRTKKNTHVIRFFLFVGLSALVVALSPLVKFPQVHLQQEVCANEITCINDLTGKFDESASEGVFLGKRVTVPQYLAGLPAENKVLGDSTVQKQIYVDLTTQHLYAFEDNKMVYDFPVSTGKWGATPTGSFTIWVKLRYTRMSGGNREIGTYYNLPNVPYTMFFYNNDVPKTRGFGVHGAYWHDNFGHPMSHGCINMKTEDVEKLYGWANPPSDSHITYATPETPGTGLIIYGETPNE
jgi:hypothetical protein